MNSDKTLRRKIKNYHKVDKEISARIAKMENDLRVMKKMFRQDKSYEV